MTDRKRLLVVEDYTPLRRGFVGALRAEGHMVDEAELLPDALRKIEEKTYHIALVDLILGEPNEARSDQFEGHRVMTRLAELDEGTLSIVISKQTSTQISAETITRYGAVDYLSKETVVDEGDSAVVRVVTKHLPDVRIRRFGHVKSVNEVMASGSVFQWEYQMVKGLQPHGGMKGLNEVLAAMCDSWLPLRPRREGGGLQLGGGTVVVRGDFWTKIYGSGLAFLLARESDERALDDAIMELGAEVKPRVRRAGLIGAIHRLPTAMREEFS